MRFIARAASGKWRVASKWVHFSGLRSTTRFTCMCVCVCVCVCVRVDSKIEREIVDTIGSRHGKLQLISS